MASVTLKNICKVFPGKVQAVDNFNLEIEDQEFVVLVGPSGCGKSTTLRMVAGLEEITSGELYIGDRLVNSIAPKDRDIAMVFQNYALYPHMTVYENMAFGLSIRKTPKPEIKKRVEEAAEILDISHLLKRKPKALSGGQRQRVALGRAIVREPKVFLLDEPLSNLDAKLRTQMRAEIAKLHMRLGTTFIYVTHDQIEAMTMGDRIVVMKDGYIQQCGSPQELYDNPQNKFVAEFIGSPQMNMFEGRFEKSGNKTYAIFSGNKVLIKEDRARQFDSSAFGRDIFIGIRPEDCCVEELCKNADPELSIDVNVEIREMLGSEIYLYLKAKGIEKNIIARLANTCSATTGQNIKLFFETSKIHAFDKDTLITLRK